jgi:hypothetical protein
MVEVSKDLSQLDLSNCFNPKTRNSIQELVTVGKITIEGFKVINDLSDFHGIASTTMAWIKRINLITQTPKKMNLVLGEMEAVIEGVYMSEKVRGDFF